MLDQLVTSNADYTKLHDLLKAKQWRKADELTGVLMLTIAKNVRNYENLNTGDAKWLRSLNYLRNEDVDRFPRIDLLLIDQLWNTSSDGQFGFSTQAEVWLDVGQNHVRFAIAVDWLKATTISGEWRSYSELLFTSIAAPGHLPAAPFFVKSELSANGAEPAAGWADNLASFLTRAVS